MTTDTVLTQTSNICETVSSGEMASRVINPPAMATGSIGDSQPVVIPPPGGTWCALMDDPGLTIPQRGGLIDIKMSSALIGASIN